MLLPTIEPAKPPRRRRRRMKQSAAPAGLVLVEAIYDLAGPMAPCVTLRFDRAIDSDGADPAVFLVNDGVEMHLLWRGYVVMPIDAAAVAIGLEPIGAAGGAEQTLTAGAGNGIVAVEDGGTWAGVEELGLPYP
jgi:hypothetical protein